MKERNMYLHVPNKMVCKTSTGVDLHVHACISKGVTVLNTLTCINQLRAERRHCISLSIHKMSSSLLSLLLL